MQCLYYYDLCASISSSKWWEVLIIPYHKVKWEVLIIPYHLNKLAYIKHLEQYVLSIFINNESYLIIVRHIC